MNNKIDINCKFTLSCGNFGIQNETNPDIYAAFWGISINVTIGYIDNNVVHSNNISHDTILTQIESYLKDKCSFSEPLMETIPKLMDKLHVHEDISEEMVASVAIQNCEGIVPEFYICDHCH